MTSIPKMTALNASDLIEVETNMKLGLRPTLSIGTIDILSK